MKNYQIFSDSACDVSIETAEQHHVQLVPFYVTFNQETYYKENIEITKSEFYHKVASDQLKPATALPSVQDYTQQFKPFLQEGQDILCLCLNQKFSGSYQSAINAKILLEKKYPDSKIIIIDSTQATAGQGLLLLQAVKMKEAGYSIDANSARLELLKKDTHTMFTLDSLEFLSRGGRIGKVATLAGNMLNIKPLIQLKDSELIPYSKVRGRKKALDKLLSMVKEHFQNSTCAFSDYEFGITYANNTEDALFLQQGIKSFLDRSNPINLFQIGTTIGTYTGPGAIGISFVKKAFSQT